MLTRRGIVAGGAGLLVAGCTVIPEGQRAAFGFRSIGPVVAGRAGVAALDTGTGVVLGHRQGERFAMAPAFKWLLAEGILNHAQHGMSLEDEMLSNRDDLLSHSPVCETRIDPETGIGRMSVKDLCEAAVTVSDNCAANLLLVPIMGREGLTRFIRQAGDGVTRLDRNQPSLNENAPIVIASYLSDSEASNDMKASAHKEIARLVVEEFA